MDPGKRTFYLGRYNCIEQLGTGPIGETYRAKIYGVAGFEKQFAVKRLHPHLSEDEAFVARFVQAASAFAALEHEHIARVHEVNAQGAHYYIVVDLVRGLDLRRLLDLLQQRGEALAADAAMTIAADIADALAYSHARTNVLPGGVLHLGLTAPSVMLTYEGELKLVDVGLLAALVRPGWSNDDALTPTLAYLAPETWRGENVDGRADVFSLGVVLHELLGGSRVFLSDSAVELRQAIETGPPPPPPADPRLQEVVTRALQPDREQRFASMAEMREALVAILGGRIDRARTELSAVVRRLAMPREKRTGAFAAVVLPPAASGITTPVTAKPPPVPPAARAWAPPTPKAPGGPVLTAPPHYNTLAGIGPDDQALVPIELVELPGKPTEKGMPTVHPDDAETNRFTRTDARELAITPSDQTTVKTRMPTEAMASPSEAEAEGWSAEAQAWSADGAATGSQEATHAAASEITGDAEPTETSMPAHEGMAPTEGGEVAAGPRVPEASWTPPAMAPPPPPSPVPVFAPPSDERPEPVEPPARSTVPAVKLPPRPGPSRAVIAVVVLLAAAGGLAIWAGVGSGQRSTADNATTKGNTAPVAVPVAADLSQVDDLAALAETRADLAAVAAVAPKQPSAPTESPTVRPTAEKPTAERPTAERPTAERPTAERPTAERPTAERPTAEKPTAEKPRANGAQGGFEVVTTPPGAAVFVDGEPQGTTPAQLTLAAGKHKLVVAAEGQKLVKRELTAEPGGRLELTLEPAKLPPEVAGAEGLKVRCKSRGELRVYVDGADSGRTCPNEDRISVAAGVHKIGLYSPRTDEMHEVEHEIAQGNNSTRVYVKY